MAAYLYCYSYGVIKMFLKFNFVLLKPTPVFFWNFFVCMYFVTFSKVIGQTLLFN